MDLLRWHPNPYYPTGSAAGRQQSITNTVDSHLPVRSLMRSDRHCGRFFSTRIRSQSKPYRRRSPMRSDHHSGLRSKFCGKTANSISSLRSNGSFQYIVMIILIGYFYIEKLSPMFSTHVQCVRKLLIWQITSLSFGDDNIKSHIAMWKIKLNVQQ